MLFPSRGEVHFNEVASLGKFGRVRIDAGSEDTFEGEFFAVKAITDDFTYGAGCEARRGYAPDEDDPVVQGDVDVWPGEKAVAATGSAWVYPMSPPRVTEEAESPASSPASP